VVAIGRNEGDRLIACLDSLGGLRVPVLYVDSGSTDDSVARAGGRGVSVHELAPDRPFSAARARNEGFDRIRKAHDTVCFVQFLDADCTLAGGWLDAAVTYLDDHDDCSAVIGHLAEREPDRNLFHRLCAMEWNGPAGDIENCDGFGGISVVRADVFEAIGGFDLTMIAGEDPEMAARMKLAGHRITKLPAEMAVHDAGIDRFSQYWRRAVRAGYAAGARASKHGNSPLRDSVRSVRSTLFWGAALPLGTLVLAPFTRGLSLLVLVGGYGVLVARMVRYRRSVGDRTPDALLYAGAMIVAKFANVLGLATFSRRHRRADYRIIEYK
jgi:GT2 family glycosyltransferase